MNGEIIENKKRATSNNFFFWGFPGNRLSLWTTGILFLSAVLISMDKIVHSLPFDKALNH